MVFLDPVDASAALAVDSLRSREIRTLLRVGESRSGVQAAGTPVTEGLEGERRGQRTNPSFARPERARTGELSRVGEDEVADSDSS